MRFRDSKSFPQSIPCIQRSTEVSGLSSTMESLTGAHEILDPLFTVQVACSCSQRKNLLYALTYDQKTYSSIIPPRSCPSLSFFPFSPI